MSRSRVRHTYRTSGAISVERTTEPLEYEGAIEPVIDALDSRRGVLFASSYEYPGRYSRWDFGFVDPPLVVVSSERAFSITALNDRGGLILGFITPALEGHPAIETITRREERELTGRIRQSDRRFPEEQRSKQDSIFSILRAIRDLLSSPEDEHLGLYGAFAYDLAFQFEPIDYKLPRASDKRDLVLYLPDELITVDHDLRVALKHSYDFSVSDNATNDLERTGGEDAYVGTVAVERRRDHEPGEFRRVVELAQEWFARGDLFEVVPGQTFFEPCPRRPSEIFRQLRETNPAPYSALINLGEREYLVGASPEMFVRVTGRRVETCPISGTVARGADALADAEQIIDLLKSDKQHAELTMCTDVDRNDKSRICEPGSVRILGRRQIEMYSKVIHTVDHVEGTLREGFDGLDAFLTHAWAVTVTGAPKLWAMRFLEEHEHSHRAWYGGAIGKLGFDGSVNTGLTLRTIRINRGIAEIRAGCTLLVDSDPEEEERETELKAAAFIEALQAPAASPATDVLQRRDAVAGGKRILLVDHEDSFVHTLANYLRQTEADVVTVRVSSSEGLPPDALADGADLVVLSPGPGRPGDFGMSHTVHRVLEAGLPLFGVCLGLQGIAEYFGGKLGVLSPPVHGKASEIRVDGGRLFQGLPKTLSGGRYHSLHALRNSLPDTLRVTAETEDGVVMAIEHATLPVAAVQFHPESLMTTKGDAGIRIVENAVSWLSSEKS